VTERFKSQIYGVSFAFLRPKIKDRSRYETRFFCAADGSGALCAGRTAARGIACRIFIMAKSCAENRIRYFA
jgi:hypothetical protein